MSASPGTAEAGSFPAEASVGRADQAAGPAGRIFRQLTVLPTLLAAAWLLAGLPLLLLGHFTPVLMLVVSVPIAAVLVTLGMRWVSGRSQGLLAARGAPAASTPWWTIAALILVAIGFGAFIFASHAQYIIISRDPASYIQFTNWISGHGSLPIPEDASAFGGYSKALTFGSPAFYQVGHAIVPQFMAGLPIVMSAAFWVGGINLAVASNALLGACAILVFGGLVGRLVGPRWAPLGALALALSLPQIYTSRETFSEPLTQILFLGGLCLFVDSFTPDGAARRGIAALAGLVIGLTLLVRIDGASDMLALIPYCGLLVLGRRRQAWPLIGGVVVGSLFGAIDGVVLSRPYLANIKASLLPLLIIGVGVLLITAAAVAWRWRKGLPDLRTNRLPNLAAALAVLITIGFVIRPYVQTTYAGSKPGGQANSISAEQALEHQPIVPNRQYYEISLHWVFWYVGVPVVILATIGAALLARRCLRGSAPAWTLPLMTFGWIIFSVLWRPSIIPDQPWASRRLVPGVLPGFILLGLWAASWLIAWLRQQHGTRPVIGSNALRYGAVAVIALAVTLPAVRTTFGIVRAPGFRLMAVGLATQRVYQGEIAAVSDLCAALPANSSVLFVAGNADHQFAPAVRGTCGLPAAAVVDPTPARVQQIVEDIRGAGRKPVLLASTQAQVAAYGSQPKHIVRLRMRVDPQTLTVPPMKTKPLAIDVWMSENPK